MKKVILSLGLILSFQSHAQAKHLFWCGKLDQEPTKQVYFEIEDDAVASGIGTLKIYEESRAGNIWEVIEEGEAKTDVVWKNDASGNAMITGIFVDMGRSGYVTAKITSDYEMGHNAEGFIKANLLNFNHPEGVRSSSCNYFYSTGPKPGMTGSN